VTADEVVELEREGARFSRIRDPNDPRFETITWRRACPVVMGGPSTKDVDVSGEQARLKGIKFVLASVAGFAVSVGRHHLAMQCEELAVKLGVLTRGVQ